MRSLKGKASYKLYCTTQIKAISITNKYRGKLSMPDKKTETYDIESLMLTYGNDVLRTAYMYVKDQYLAEDIFQDVFLKVNQKLHTFEGKSSIKTWIIRITINTCKDYLKSAWNKRVTPITEYQEQTLREEKDEFDEVERKEDGKMIRNVIMELPDIYKEVVILVYYQEMTISEVASVLKVAEGTIKSRLARAKEKLRIYLEGRI